VVLTQDENVLFPALQHQLDLEWMYCLQVLNEIDHFPLTPDMEMDTVIHCHQLVYKLFALLGALYLIDKPDPLFEMSFSRPFRPLPEVSQQVVE